MDRSEVYGSKRQFCLLKNFLTQKVADFNPRVSVFERLTYAQAASTVSLPRQHNGTIKGDFNALVNEYSSGGQGNNHWSFNQPTERHLGTNLPGFLSSFKFPTFPSLDWPDKSFLSWFKAHGSVPQIQLVSSFGDFSFFQSQVAENLSLLASSASPSLSLFSKNPMPSSAPGSPATSSAAMANIHIDPRPFMPHGFKIQHIAGRVGVKRVVVSRKPRLHEQYTIATIAPFPQGQVHFGNVREVLEEYLNEVAEVGFQSIQECPFGAAYVQFTNVSDRERLIHSSPNAFGDVNISFCKHDEGPNWRATNFNRDAWVLMVGPPLDHMNTEDLNACFHDIGTLLLWERDPNKKGRVVAKVRVTNLEEIPKKH